jgi:hypothetical protein
MPRDAPVTRATLPLSLIPFPSPWRQRSLNGRKTRPQKRLSKLDITV